jgi:hypothetical protein
VTHQRITPPVDDEILLPATPSEAYGLGRLKRIVTKFPSEPLEVMGALSMMAMGIWLLLPFIDFPTEGVIAVDSGGWTRWWGLGLVLIGFYKWWAILWHYENRLHRLAAAMLSGTVFFMVMMAYIRHAPNHVMVVIMGLWQIHQAWIAYRSQQTWRSHK